MVNFEELTERLNEVVEDVIRECKKVTDKQRGTCGLDIRAVPYTMYYNHYLLILPKQYRKLLDYYGGFEFVDEKHVTEAGNYVIYDGEDCRVSSVMVSLMDNEE